MTTTTVESEELMMDEKDFKQYKKDELIRMVLDERQKTDGLAAQNEQLVRQIADIVTVKISDAMKPLIEEIQALKAQVAKLEATTPQQTNALLPTEEHGSATRYLVGVVRDTVRDNRMHDEAKAQVVIANAKDEGKDEAFITDLLRNINHNAMPKETVRIGRKTENKDRMMRVTFGSNFDARTFLSRFENKGNDDVPSIQVRPYRSKEEQMNYNKHKKKLKDLNDAAKEAGDDCSYSLRNNGAIWKFIKVGENKWRRDDSWVLEEKSQGNQS